MKCKCCQQNEKFYVNHRALELLVGIARMPIQYRRARQKELLRHKDILNCQCYNVLEKLVGLTAQLTVGEQDLFDSVERLAKGKD